MKLLYPLVTASVRDLEREVPRVLGDYPLVDVAVGVPAVDVVFEFIARLE